MTADEPLHFPGYEFEPPTPDGPESRDGWPAERAPPGELERAHLGSSGIRVGRARQVGELASTHLRARTVDHPAAVASTLRTGLGALRPAPALALRLRRGAAWFRSPRLAPGLRRGPRTPARLGRRLRLPPRPRQSDTSDRVARGRSGTVGRRGHDRGPGSRLPQIRRRRRRARRRAVEDAFMAEAADSK